MLLSVIRYAILLPQPEPFSPPATPCPPRPGYCAPNQRPPRWGGWFPLSTYPSRAGASVGVAGNCPRSYTNCGDGRLVVDPQHTAADRWMSGCFLAGTGKPFDCSICFTTWVDAGDSLLTGHSHDLSREEFPDRMLITRGVVWSELDYQRRPFRTSTGFHGRTSSRGYATIATAPEVGTIVRFSIWARAHDGPARNFWFLCHPANWATTYLCVPPHPPDLRFYMPKEEYLDGVWHFYVPGLERLAEGPDVPYILCDYFSCCRKNDGSSSGHPPHPEPFWGFTRELQGVITHVGREFQARAGTDVKLLVGDASLKDGGLLDICGGWNPPHVRHRLGRSADITLQSVYAREGDTWHVRPMGIKEQKSLTKKACPRYGETEVAGVGKVHFSCVNEKDHLHVELLPLIPADPRHPPCPEIPLKGEVCLPFFPE